MRSFLEEINDALSPDEWKIHYIYLAPYAPKENSIKNVWLQGKNFVRRQPHRATSFQVVKQLFVLGITRKVCFNFSKAKPIYVFSELI